MICPSGFEALKPQPRADRGQPRAVSAETLDRAEALKREQPFRSARSIAAILAKDNTQPIPEAKLAPRTRRRQLARRGATTAQLLTEQRPKAYCRFERAAFGDLWQGDAMHGPHLPDRSAELTTKPGSTRPAVPGLLVCFPGRPYSAGPSRPVLLERTTASDGGLF